MLTFKVQNFYKCQCRLTIETSRYSNVNQTTTCSVSDLNCGEFVVTSRNFQFPLKFENKQQPTQRDLHKIKHTLPGLKV